MKFNFYLVKSLVPCLICLFVFCMVRSEIITAANNPVEYSMNEVKATTNESMLRTLTHYGYVKGLNGGTGGLPNVSVTLFRDNQPIASTVTDAQGYYRFDTPAPFCGVPLFYVTASAPTWTPVSTGGNSKGCPGENGYRFEDIIMVRVESVSWEEVYTGQIDDNPTIANPGGGKRIFPDKQSHNDPVNRRLIRVKVTTSCIQCNDMGVVLVHVKSFDVDDPSTDTFIDPNGNAGNDNKGDRRTGGRAGRLNASEGTTQNGIITFDFVPTMQPGDNFVIAASLDSNYLNGITVNGTGLKDTSGNEIPINTATNTFAKRTEMLTVWRRFHVEVDSMGPVTGNKVVGTIISDAISRSLKPVRVNVDQQLEPLRFQGGRVYINGIRFYVDYNTENALYIHRLVATNNRIYKGSSFVLYDDDDFNSNDGVVLDGDQNEDVEAVPEIAFKLMCGDGSPNQPCNSDDPEQNVYAKAYMRPEYNWARNMGYNNSNVTFNLNVGNTNQDFDNQTEPFRDSKNNEADDFWIVYVQLGYQGGNDRDFDSDYEDIALFGRTVASADATDEVNDDADQPTGGHSCLIYLETIKDFMTHYDQELSYCQPYTTVPHEVGHQFGIRGDAPLLGIMSQSCPQSGFPEPGLEFVPRHINLLRWRITSPGVFYFPPPPRPAL